MSSHHHAHRVFIKVLPEAGDELRFECTAKEVIDAGKQPFARKLAVDSPMGALFDAFVEWYGSAKLFFVFDGDLVSRNDVVKDLELKPDDKIFAIESSGDDKRDEAEIAWMSVSSHGKSMGAPLIAACADGNVRRVRKLLRQGENVQEQYFEGGSEEAGTRRRPSPPSHAGTGSKTLGTEEVPMTPLRAAKAFGGAKPELLKILIDAGATE